MGEQRGVRVAEDGEQWRAVGQRGQAAQGREGAGGGHDPAQCGPGDVEEGEEFVVQVARGEVEQLGPRGVANLGEGAAGQRVQEVGVHGAQAQGAGAAAGPGGVVGVEEGRHLQGGEHRVEREARAAADLLVGAGAHEPVRAVRPALVLPADQGCDGPSGRRLPQDDGLALSAQGHPGHRTRVRVPQAAGDGAGRLERGHAVRTGIDGPRQGR
nr:hypothetical protein [Streptomyces olivaceus]